MSNESASPVLESRNPAKISDAEIVPDESDELQSVDEHQSITNIGEALKEFVSEELENNTHKIFLESIELNFENDSADYISSGEVPKKSVCKEVSNCKFTNHSFYPKSLINKHKKMIKKKKQLEKEGLSEDEDEEEELSPELDINLRIFEDVSTNTTVGEIHVNDNRKLIDAKLKRQEISEVVKDKSSDHLEAEAEETNNKNGNTSDEEYLKSDLESSHSSSDDEDFLDPHKVLMRSSKRRGQRRPIPKRPADGEMTMKDLLYFTNNSADVESDTDSDIDDPSPVKRVSSIGNVGGSSDDDNSNSEDSDDENCGGEVSSSLPTKARSAVPQVRINEHGQVVFDESSLVAEETGADEARKALEKAPLIDASQLKLGVYSKRKATKRWTPAEMLKFYFLLGRCGTDFTFMSDLWSERDRNELKRKFKKEESVRPFLVEMALKSKLHDEMDALKDEFQKHFGDVEAENKPASKTKKRSRKNRTKNSNAVSNHETSAAKNTRKRKKIK